LQTFFSLMVHFIFDVFYTIQSSRLPEGDSDQIPTAKDWPLLPGIGPPSPPSDSQADATTTRSLWPLDSSVFCNDYHVEALREMLNADVDVPKVLREKRESRVFRVYWFFIEKWYLYGIIWYIKYQLTFQNPVNWILKLKIK